MSAADPTLDAALDAIGRGFQVVPIRPASKRPTIMAWPQITWDPATTAEQFETRLKEWGFSPGDNYNLGVILGEPSGGLVDVDLDHPKAKRFRDFLPRTHARSGRPGSADSHFWYLAEGDDVPGFRQYKLKDAATVTVEFRSTSKLQTVFPPSDWVPKDWETDFNSDPALREIRTWSREPWGGKAGPARVNGRKLALQVALVGLGTVLLEGWPTAGGRHEAYLALAGGLLRLGDGLVHPFWERNASVLIRALAVASRDDDGPDAREAESVDSTIRNLRDGKLVWGFPKLAETLGDDQVAMIRTLVAEVESLAGYSSRQATALTNPTPAATALTPAPTAPSTPAAPNAPTDGLPVPENAPAEPATSDEPPSWGPLDLDPYLNGQLPSVAPTVLVRDDGRALFYPGRVNMLFAPSESGKTLLALYTCLERIAAGERVVYIDFEDEPSNTIERLRSMGASDDDLRLQFTYIQPDEPIASMQRDHWGSHKATPVGEANAILFNHTVEQIDPTLIIADGMTSIYGLHGLDSNNSVETDVITTWLKSLSRNGRTTVVIIDHMSKASGKGSMPIGSQHKVSMVQGTLLQVWPKTQPTLGGVGEVELIVLKDRPGQVRRYAGTLSGRAQLAATVLFDSLVDGVTTVSVLSPPAKGAPNAPGSSNSLQLDLSNGAAGTDSAAFTKLADQSKQDQLILNHAYDNSVGKSLKLKEVKAAVGPFWRGESYSETAFVTTMKRLIATGYLLKVGGPRGPNVTYVLQVGLTPPTPADASTPDAD